MACQRARAPCDGSCKQAHVLPLLLSPFSLAPLSFVESRGDVTSRGFLNTRLIHRLPLTATRSAKQAVSHGDRGSRSPRKPSLPPFPCLLLLRTCKRARSRVPMQSWYAWFSLWRPGVHRTFRTARNFPSSNARTPTFGSWSYVTSQSALPELAFLPRDSRGPRLASLGAGLFNAERLCAAR